MGPPDLVGKTLDRYRILELLGSGGMGAVYLAEHERIQKKVALKVLHPHLAEAFPQSVTRMLNEARAAARVGHPAIVEVLDYGDTPDGYHFLVMELLDGRPLSELLEEKGRLGLQTSLAIAAPILGGLQAAHDKGIVHRDLKPENVFLHRMPLGGYGVKLLDFGISKFTLDQDARLTSTGAVLGTPAYMSLEQVEGRTDVDHRTDIYAAGVILYRCLSGRLPYEGENPNQIMAAIVRNPPPPLASLCPELPEGLVRAVDRAMARDRGDRFQSAAEFWAALAPFYDPTSPEPAHVLSEFLPSSGPLAPPGVLLAGMGLATAPKIPATPAGPPASAPEQPVGGPGAPPRAAGPDGKSAASIQLAPTLAPGPMSGEGTSLPEAPSAAPPQTVRPSVSLPGPPRAESASRSAAAMVPQPAAKSSPARLLALVLGTLVVVSLAIAGIVRHCSEGGRSEKKRARTSRIVRARARPKKRRPRNKRRRSRTPRFIRRLRRIFR